MASKQKNVVSKDSLRRLMKERTSASKNSSTKIDHPCAKYNALEQLTCSVCKTVIKNERLWNAHIMGRSHKEAIAALKHKVYSQDVPAPPSVNTSKRSISDECDMVSKKHKSSNSTKNSIPDDFFDNNTTKKKSILKNPIEPKSILKNNFKDSVTNKKSLPPTDPDDIDNATNGAALSGNTESNLPSNFFDAGTSAQEPETTPLDPSMAEKLPEGFFDDPKTDAKVREIEYKDKMEEEWEMFQKAMKEQNTVSEAILDEDDEQKTIERKMEEVDDQMHRWSQIHALAQKKETTMAEKDQSKYGQDAEMGSGAESDSDLDLDELLDWRSKKAVKS